MNPAHLPVYWDIEEERRRQLSIGVIPLHDSETPETFHPNMIFSLSHDVRMCLGFETYVNARKYLIRMAAMVVLWIEFVDRKAGAEPRQPPFGTLPIGETKSEIEERKGGHDE